jgi:hypothetical protein
VASGRVLRVGPGSVLCGVSLIVVAETLEQQVADLTATVLALKTEN